MNLEERVEQLEFQVELLFNNSPLDRFLFECNITRKQRKAIMDLMDSYRSRIDAGENVDHVSFERDICSIVPEVDYHFCESVAQLFADDGKWTEVFPTLYGNMTKYSGLKK